MSGYARPPPRIDGMISLKVRDHYLFFHALLYLVYGINDLGSSYLLHEGD